MYTISFTTDYRDLNEKAFHILWEKDMRALKKTLMPRMDGKFFSKDALLSFMKGDFSENAPLIQERCIFCQNQWHLQEKKWQQYLKRFFARETSPKTLTAAFTFLPLYPRDLENNCFLIPVLESCPDACSVIAHELTHFYDYDVWGQIADNFALTTSKKWILSELLIPFLFRDFGEKTGYFFHCSSYLFSKEGLKQCYPVFQNAWRQKEPFFFFLKEMETQDFSQYIHTQFLQD